MRDDLKFIRKPRWLDFTVRKTPSVTVSEQLIVVDQLKLEDKVVLVKGVEVYDMLLLIDGVGRVVPITDTLVLSDQVFAELHEPRLVTQVENTITLIEKVRLGIDKYVGDQISLQDSLSVEPAITAIDNLLLSDSVNTSIQTVQQQQVSVTDTLYLSDSVQATLQQVGIIIPDSYTVYNHNWQPISANLSVWWDNNTGTSYSVYFSPPNPSNPRWVFLYFNNDITLPRTINIHISGYTPNKTLYITAYYYGEFVSSASITPTATGWYSVQLSAQWGDRFDEIGIYTDSNVYGFIGISEFHISSS